MLVSRTRLEKNLAGWLQPKPNWQVACKLKYNQVKTDTPNWIAGIIICPDPSGP